MLFKSYKQDDWSSVGKGKVEDPGGWLRSKVQKPLNQQKYIM